MWLNVRLAQHCLFTGIRQVRARRLAKFHGTGEVLKRFLPLEGRVSEATMSRWAQAKERLTSEGGAISRRERMKHPFERVLERASFSSAASIVSGSDVQMSKSAFELGSRA